MKFWSFDNYDVVKSEDTNIYIAVDRCLRDKANVLDHIPELDAEDVSGIAVELIDTESIRVEKYCDIECLAKCYEQFNELQNEETNNEGVVITAYKYNNGDKTAFIGISFNDVLIRRFKPKRTIDSIIILIEAGNYGCAHISQYIINHSRGVPFDLVSIDNELFLRIGTDITNIKNAETAYDKLDKEYEVL